MRKLCGLLFAVAALFGGTPALADVSGVGVDDACACGGEIYVVWQWVYWPNGTDQPAWCGRLWNNGNITYTVCY